MIVIPLYIVCIPDYRIDILYMELGGYSLCLFSTSNEEAEEGRVCYLVGYPGKLSCGEGLLVSGLPDQAV